MIGPRRGRLNEYGIHFVWTERPRCSGCGGLAKVFMPGNQALDSDVAIQLDEKTQIEQRRYRVPALALEQQIVTLHHDDGAFRGMNLDTAGHRLFDGSIKPRSTNNALASTKFLQSCGESVYVEGVRSAHSFTPAKLTQSRL